MTSGTSYTETDEIVAAIRRHEAVRHTLSTKGRLSIDRNLPYLFVYRYPEHEDPGTVRLILGEASYLVADTSDSVAELVRCIAEAGAGEYGAFLVLEVWAGSDTQNGFTIRCPEGPVAADMVRALEQGLGEMVESQPGIGVRTEPSELRHPPGMPSLLSIRESWDIGCLLVGLEVPPVYRDPETGNLYPVFLRSFRQELSRILRQAVYEFLRVQTHFSVPTFRALGTRTLHDSVWDADRELSEIERSYQLLVLTSPVNEKQAWQQFRDAEYQQNPAFHYRLLPMDPDVLKRRLFAIPMEEMEDPAMALLLRDKREELDKQISMLEERGSRAFLYSSMRLFGVVDEKLLGLANDLLASVPPAGGGRKPTEWVDAAGFQAAAAREFAEYAALFPAFSNQIQLRPDLTGLMVSTGNLLIGETLRLNPGRVDALIQHEVGTHVLTYANGSAQPLKQLALGLADYDELQEGLAVLSEYLVGGLDRSRMRLLAARVVAAQSVEQGAEFVETFRQLVHDHGFTPVGAYGIASRVHTCGGFTRDLIYLRGLVELLEYLEDGGELEPLYIGKLALKHVPILEELRDREVLSAPPLRPRFLERPEAVSRLDAVRRGIALAELIREETP